MSSVYIVCVYVYMSVFVYSPVAIGFIPTLVPVHITLAYTVLQLNQGRGKVVVTAKKMKVR